MGQHDYGEMRGEEPRDSEILNMVADMLQRFWTDETGEALMPVRAIVVATVMNPEGKQQIMTVNTDHPAWVSLGMLSAATLQAETALIRALRTWEEGDDGAT